MHGIFLIFVFFICYSNQDPTTYYQNKAIYNVIPNIKKVNNHRTFWTWMEKHAIPELYPTIYYNKRNRTSYDLKHTSELNQMRFSSVRLFQIRVKEQKCTIDASLKTFFKNRTCFGEFSSSKLSTQNFSRFWEEFNDNNTHPGFFYSENEEGYSLPLGKNFYEALKLVKELKQFGWIDRQTRLIKMDVTVMNHETVSQAYWKFELREVGGIYATIRSDSLKVYRYTGAGGLVTLIFEILSIISWLLLVMRGCYRFWRYSEIPGFLLLLSLIFYVLSIGLYISRTIIGVKTIEKVMNSRTEYEDLSIFFNMHEYFMICIGFCGFFGELHVLTMIRISRTISVLVSTLKKSRPELATIGFCCCIVFIGFALWGYLILGTNTENYKSFKYTCYALIVTVFGHLDFDVLSETAGTMGKIFITSYASVMLYLILNIFITTLNEFLSAVKADPTVLPIEHKAFSYIKRHISNMFWRDEDSADIKETIDERIFRGKYLLSIGNFTILLQNNEML